MNKYFLIILLINTSFVLGQSAPKPNNTFEIITYTTGYNSNYNTVKFWMDAIGPVWDKDSDPYNLAVQSLTSNFKYAITADYRDVSPYLIEDVPIPNSTSYYGIWHTLTNWNRPKHVYGYGLYSFKIGPTKDNIKIQFYLDLTDCDYSDFYCRNDTWIEYNASTETARIDWNNDNFTDSVTIVQNVKKYKFWIEKNKSTRNNIQNTAYLELYLTISSQNGHPYLSWNEYHDESSMLHYNVYKKESGGAYSVLATTNNTYYVDNNETFYSFPNQKEYVYYNISAQLNVSQESLFGNEERVAVNEIQNIEKISEENENISDESYNFNLLPNYPNPFNPSTSITYQLPKKGHVALKVYNTLGKEVAELINETKEEGTYSVTFNGDNFPSGMYFYKIQTGEFVEVKKMLLLK